jgi:hypothetical protein
MEQLIQVLNPFAAAIGGTASIIWFLSIRFASLEKLIFTTAEQTKNFVLDKLEYHERHDDARFDSLTKDLWTIKVRNAAIDGRSSTAQ